MLTLTSRQALARTRMSTEAWIVARTAPPTATLAALMIWQGQRGRVRVRRRTMVRQAAMLTSSLTRADLQLSPKAAPALTPTLSAARS